MRELLLRDPYSCTPVCHVSIMLELLAAAIGPAGDNLHVPMRVVGGTVTGSGADKDVVGGTDFATMYADEKFVHNGNIVIADPDGDVILWFDGPSQAEEGAYDLILDGGRLPGESPCRLAVRSVSTGREWRQLNRRPLLGVGTFDGTNLILNFTLLSVAEKSGRN